MKRSELFMFLYVIIGRQPTQKPVTYHNTEKSLMYNCLNLIQKENKDD